MNNKEKLTEATIKALQGKLQEDENKDRIHIVIADVSDDYYDNVDKAIKEIDDTYSSLMLDDPQYAEQIYYPILEWLNEIKDGNNEEREYIVTHDEFDSVAEIDDDIDETDNDKSDIDDIYYDEYEDDTVSNTSDFIKYCYDYNKDKILGKQYIIRKNWNTKQKSIDEFPSVEQIIDDVINKGALVVINEDYVYGKAIDVISVYAEYTNNRFDPIMNCYNLSNKAKKQISSIKNGKKPYKDDYMYMGIDSDNLLYGNEAKSQFSKTYNESIKNKYFRCYLYLI